MSTIEQFAEPPVVPIYIQESPNDPIALGQVALRFTCNGQTYDERANAVIRFMPRQGLEFVCPMEGAPPFFGLHAIFDAGGCQRFELTDRGIEFDGFCIAIGGDHGGAVFVPHTSGMTVTPPSSTISRVRFHLFNFPDFHGPDDYALVIGMEPRPGWQRCGRVTLKADGWSITIVATHQTRDLSQGLRAQGGYVLTHAGEITREDKSVFASDEIEGMLTCLQYFLSFVLGRWAGVALSVGTDSDGKTVFEEWGMRITADGAWKGSCSWFDIHHGELLKQVFPGFVKLWTNDVWRVPLQHGLYWYLGASDRGTGIGPDTGLILAQTALEGLAWTYCVQDRKMVSAGAFKPRGLTAADKLRLLATSLGIPTIIPPELTALQAKPGKKWDDALDAITSIRNSLIHSDSSDPLPDNSFYEAWMLSLWLIDMVLLRLCDHNGSYSNRISKRLVGSVTSVPWSSAKAGVPTGGAVGA
jgi:hypothetical protein